MGQRCGCVGKECNCAIVPGRGVSLSGAGSQSVPLEVTQNAPSFLRAASTDHTDVTLSGTGVATDPFLLGMAFTGTPESKPLSITTFSLGGTYIWTRPAGCTLVEVTCIGAGAGGAAGSNPTAGSAWGYGGLGGQGGGWTKKLLALPVEVTTLTCSVGYGGSPGTSPGENGGEGFASYVIAGTNFVQARGGASGGVVKGWGFHRGWLGPVVETSLAPSRVNNPAGGGGGKGANGNEDENGSIYGGEHTYYSGGINPGTPLGGGDGGKGGRAFQGTALVATGLAGNGYAPGGGGGGGRGGASGLVQYGSTWSFIPSAGGGGAPGLIRIVAY